MISEAKLGPPYFCIFNFLYNMFLRSCQLTKREVCKFDHRRILSYLGMIRLIIFPINEKSKRIRILVIPIVIVKKVVFLMNIFN